eukprot:1152641-Pelagomonas_calceolata.AAC.2
MHNISALPNKSVKHFYTSQHATFNTPESMFPNMLTHTHESQGRGRLDHLCADLRAGNITCLIHQQNTTWHSMLMLAPEFMGLYECKAETKDGVILALTHPHPPTQVSRCIWEYSKIIPSAHTQST